MGIEAKLADQDIEELLKCKYQGKYTYLVLSLLYPDRGWKDSVFHEDHIFPKSEFHGRRLRKRGYDDERIERYLSYCDTVLNLELLTNSENLSKSSTPFDKWLSTRDSDFKKRHHIPKLDDYNLNSFDKFIEKREALLTRVLKNL